MSVIVWLVMGALVGWVASLLMKTDGSQGTILNIVVGIVGGALGGVLFRFFGFSGANINEGISIYSFVVSVIGAIALLGVVLAIRKTVARPI
ncbi:MAG: GlsB/YeaQ/YmgE family stress response membrane protein [Myxococcales bacterium]|nr:GlsB/YeaQ/YmgE family stress response membrane protein [Myxococcales bacterium]